MREIFRRTAFLLCLTASIYGAVAEGASIDTASPAAAATQPALPQGSPVPPAQIPVEVGRVLDSANQALSVTDRTANQTLVIAQAAIKAAESTMSEVRNAHQNLLSWLLAVLTLATIALGVLGFKTLPDKVKEVAKAHAKSILEPKVKELNGHLEKLRSTNETQDATIGALAATNTGLQDQLRKLQDASQLELEHIAQIKKEHESLTASLRKNIVSFSHGNYGLMIGITAETRGNQAKEIWSDSADWLSRAVENADSLDLTLQRWLLLTLAYSQKRAERPREALASTEKAMGLAVPKEAKAAKSEAINFYNAACYAGLCHEKDKMLKYLDEALKLDPSDAKAIIEDKSRGVSGERDLVAYWEDSELRAVLARFS